MTKKNITNQAASVHQRLLNLARTRQRPFNELLQYYAMERYLYRLSQSRHRDRFILKGALTLLIWQTPVTRPTRDIDLLGRLSNDLEAVKAVIGNICQEAVPDDGLVFDPSSVTTERIAEDADYEGARAKFQGRLGNARLAMQIDIGFSDVITPAPIAIEYPSLLGHERANLMAYNRETAVAEKLEAMVSLGALNTRLKDFFDLWLLASYHDFDGALLKDAIAHTFARRQTTVVADPVCFTDGFATEPSKAAQWAAFLRNNHLDGAPGTFDQTVRVVREFLQPLLAALVGNTGFSMSWRAHGPWRT